MQSLKTLGIVLALMMCAMAVHAAETSSVYVVHGIPGADLGAAPKLPVDVSVNGACALKNFKFGQIVGPVELPAGSTRVQISLANPDNPCGGAVAIGPATFQLAPGENASIIAYLTAEGKPSARKYSNDASKTAGGRSRIKVHHTAYAPSVDISISPKANVNMVRNGEYFTLEASKGEVQVSIAPAGSDSPVFGPASLTLEKKQRYLVFAVGSVTNNTFTLLVQPY